MPKRRFSHAERFGVWQAYGGRCFWCGEPLVLKDTTIDHVIPESTSPEHLKEIITEFGLPENFKLNDFPNWVPCHATCNQLKAKRVFRYSPAMIATLDKVERQARKARAAAKKVQSDLRKDKILGELAVAIEREVITLDDIRLLFDGLEIPALIRSRPETLVLIPGAGVTRSTQMLVVFAGGSSVRIEMPQASNRSRDESTVRRVRDPGSCPVCGRPY